MIEPHSQKKQLIQLHIFISVSFQLSLYSGLDTVKYFIFARLKFREFGDFCKVDTWPSPYPP